MMTRDQWDKMTDQQQWDYVNLLESMVDSPMSDEAVNDALKDLEQTPSADELLAVPTIPFDDLPFKFDIPGGDFILGLHNFLPLPSVTVYATSPQYHQQFGQFGNTRLQD